jgi:ABC-type bacteriocin/lantibiotic exporter with double-glycine peptidase domain
LRIIVVNLLVTCLNLLSPFYINQIIEYIETKDDKVSPPSL